MLVEDCVVVTSNNYVILRVFNSVYLVNYLPEKLNFGLIEPSWCINVCHNEII